MLGRWTFNGGSLAGSADVSGWGESAFAVTGGTVPFRMTLRKLGGETAVTYNIGGTDYAVGGKTAVPVVAEGEVTGVAYGGCGQVRALSAERGKLGLVMVLN